MAENLSISWRCRDGVDLAPGTDGGLTLTIAPDTELDLRPPCPAVRDALLCLRTGADEESLSHTICADGHTLALLFHYLGKLRRHGLLGADLKHQDELLGTLVPRSRGFDVTLPRATQGRWQLSRFAYLRRDGNDLVLECPGVPCVAHLKSREVLGWLHQASRPMVPEPGTPAAGFLALLAQLEFLVDADAEESEPRRTWEFHDRLFHDRARRHDDFRPHGGTYRFRDRFASPPAIRPPHAGETIPLAIPRPSASRPLSDVMEERRSRREMGEPPITRDQVAELLYRVARGRETLPSALQECLRRPYPSGGAIHELEFYLAVGACHGLPKGFYHYRGDEHTLTKLERGATPAREMLADCAAAWGQPGKHPQCMIVLASRLPRLAWKYEAIAYKISLMNAGVVLQSLYLVCTDLGLNGSAVGSGRPSLFAAATNTSSWEETSIAEFGLGSRPG